MKQLGAILFTMSFLALASVTATAQQWRPVNYTTRKIIATEKVSTASVDGKAPKLNTAAKAVQTGTSPQVRNLTPQQVKVNYDVFRPIAKYISAGDAESLSAWFADNLEISVLSRTNDSSRNQAKQIMKSFFSTYAPRSFDITHTAGQSNMKYALGTLNAGGQVFEVTIFVSNKKSDYRIQQLRIQKSE